MTPEMLVCWVCGVVCQEEERLLERFMTADAPKSLGQLIFEKIKEAEESRRAGGGTGDAAGEPVQEIPTKAVEVFSQVCVCLRPSVGVVVWGPLLTSNIVCGVN
jgi:hypothetical protein